MRWKERCRDGEIQRDAERCREMQRDAERCREAFRPAFSLILVRTLPESRSVQILKFRVLKTRKRQTGSSKSDLPSRGKNEVDREKLVKSSNLTLSNLVER